MLNQSHAGGATDAIHINSWLANIATTARPSGPENPSFVSVYADESGIDETVKEREDDSLEWAAERFSTLLRDFKGQWILIKNHHIIANAVEPIDLLRQAIAMGIKKPLILNVEPSTAASRDAFVI